jgi:hypothetical protein
VALNARRCQPVSQVLTAGPWRLAAEGARLRFGVHEIARAASQGGKPGGPDRDDVWAMLRVAEALRDHVKALLKANLVSWRDSNAGEPSR